jgi:hypothetical protein
MPLAQNLKFEFSYHCVIAYNGRAGEIVTKSGSGCFQKCCSHLTN